MSPPSLLVVSPDSLTAALIGTLLEPSDYAVVFPRPDQPLLDEIARAKPDLVLVDVEHPAVRSRSLFDGIRSAGARAAVFGRESEVPLPTVGPGVDRFALPVGRGELESILRRVMSLEP